LDNERKTKGFYKKRQKDVFERLYSQQRMKTTKSGAETDELQEKALRRLRMDFESKTPVVDLT